MDGSDREKERDRSRRGDRPSRFSDATRDRSNDRDRSDTKRLFVSNIPYEYRWTELKDLFKEKVGDVAYVELYNDDSGKPRGCGVVEFTNSEAMKRALSVMHRYDLNGRKLVLKEETGRERNRTTSRRDGGGGGGGGGGSSGGGGGGGGGSSNRNNRHDDKKDSWSAPPREPENFNTYGLSLQFLDSINVQPPLSKKVFVANLDYKVDTAKVKEVFKMAGKVRNIDLAVDKDGNSRGFAVVEYEHPVEAVQAISLFDKQTLFERRMAVRMDRGTDKTEIRLPEGLKCIGLGLGPNGEPIRDVAKNLPQNNTATMNIQNTAQQTLGTGVLGAVGNAAVGLNGLAAAGLATNPLSANTALGGTLGLQALGLTNSLGALQNQLLQQGLTATDLASVLTGGGGGGGGLDLGASVLAGNMLAATNNGMSAGNMNSESVGSRNIQYLSAPRSAAYSSKLDVDIKDNMSSMYGRDNSQSQQKPKDLVAIRNLPSTVTWQLIREKFGECGEVKYAEMANKEMAVVRFASEWEAQRAVNMFDRTRIDGRTIDVHILT